MLQFAMCYKIGGAGQRLTSTEADVRTMKLLDRFRKFFDRDNLPRSRLARISIGTLLVIGGLFGILPILGFWMIPVGLMILAIDIPSARRFIQKVAPSLLSRQKE